MIDFTLTELLTGLDLEETENRGEGGFMSINLQPLPRAKVDGSDCEDRWINRRTPNGFYAWVGEEYPYPDDWRRADPVSEFAQIFAVVDDRSEFDRDMAIREIERRSGSKWGIVEEYDLEKVDFEDGRIYSAVVLRRDSVSPPDESTTPAEAEAEKPER